MKTVMNFLLKIFELLKSDPKTLMAKYIIFAGIGLEGLGSFSYHIQTTDTSQTFAYSGELDYFGYFLLFIGVVMLIHRYITIKNNAVTLAYGIGMENMDTHIPIDAIPKYERFDCIEINLVAINSYNKETVIENYNFNKILIGERIKNKNSKKVYIGALGSFPYLFLLGSLFRNAYSNINILDYNRHSNGGGKWYKLPSFSENKDKIHHQLISNNNSTIDDEIEKLCNNDSSDIGIALCYTFLINKDAIPNNLKENTLFLKHSYGIGHDKLSSEEAQKELLNELSVLMASLWNSKSKIHLFVAAQASMCINMGKSYMNNAHGILVLHNYDNNSKSYNWDIEFNKGNVQ